MAKWIAVEKARAGLRHVVVCSIVTGRTKNRIAQIKPVRAGTLAIVDYKWRKHVPSGCLVCRCPAVFL